MEACCVTQMSVSPTVCGMISSQGLKLFHKKSEEGIDVRQVHTLCMAEGSRNALALNRYGLVV